MANIRRTSRTAFTLVEMLVATALTLFIMAIISQTFGQATKTFSKLRTAGQLQERTRGAINLIRRDLATEHFAGPYPGGRGGPFVGSQRLDLEGWQPPAFGFFAIRQNGPSLFEPIGAPLTDGEGLASTRATSHVLQFTSHLPAGQPTELFSANVFDPVGSAATNSISTILKSTRFAGNEFVTGSSLYYSRWSEICYFLWPSGDTTATGVQLFSLRRKAKLLAPKSVDFTLPVQLMTIADAALFVAGNPDLALRFIPIAPNQAYVQLMGPEVVANPGARMALVPQTDLNGNQTGSDIVLTDVIGFELKAAWSDNPWFNDPTINPDAWAGSSPANLVDTDNPYSDLPPSTLSSNPLFSGQRHFDTWFRDSLTESIDWDAMRQPNYVGYLVRAPWQVPLRINVRSLQVKFRIYDTKAEQTRQVTLVQEI